MILPLLAAGYLAIHFGAYLAWRGRSVVLRREGGIFTYHVLSYVFCVGGTAVGAHLVPAGGVLVPLVFAASLHGIYSLSFLELWALTHRSYSLAILDQIAQAGGVAPGTQLLRLQSIGAAKRTLRADALRRLGLVAVGPGLRPTPAGRICAAFCATLLWLSNGKPVN